MTKRSLFRCVRLFVKRRKIGKYIFFATQISVSLLMILACWSFRQMPLLLFTKSLTETSQTHFVDESQGQKAFFFKTDSSKFKVHGVKASHIRKIKPVADLSRIDHFSDPHEELIEQITGEIDQLENLSNSEAIKKEKDRIMQMTSRETEKWSPEARLELSKRMGELDRRLTKELEYRNRELANMVERDRELARRIEETKEELRIRLSNTEK